MMFATLCWFLACNESNRIESNRLVCGTESNRIESFSLLPNRPSLVKSIKKQKQATLDYNHVMYTHRALFYPLFLQSCSLINDLAKSIVHVCSSTAISKYLTTLISYFSIFAS